MENENKNLAPVTDVAEKAVPVELVIVASPAAEVVEKEEPMVEKEVVFPPVVVVEEKTEKEEEEEKGVENAQEKTFVVAPKEDTKPEPEHPQASPTTEEVATPSSSASDAATTEKQAETEEMKEEPKEVAVPGKQQEEDKPSVLAKMASFLHKKHSTASEPALPKVQESVVPKYRFITSMQGHGYPVTPIPMTEAGKPTKRGLGLTALFKGSTSTKDVKPAEAHKEEKHRDTHKEAAPSVPAYRFISTMQGHGYPVAPITTATPAPVVAASPPKKTGLMGTLFKSKSKKHEEAPAKEEEEKMSRSHGPLTAEKTAMSVEDVSTTTVPEYRFISSMQGHGYPVTPVNTIATVHAATANATANPHAQTTGSPAAKRGRRGLMHALLSLFRRDGKKNSKSVEHLPSGSDHNNAPNTPPVAPA